MTATRPHARKLEPVDGRAALSYGPTLAVSVTLAVAWFLLLMSLVLLVVHPQFGGLGAFSGLVNQQNQKAKTALYVTAFAGVLPLALFSAVRLVRTIEAGPNAGSLRILAAGLPASFAAVLILVRVSHRLPWGDGLGTLLVAVGGWLIAAAAVLRRATRQRAWGVAVRLRRAELPVLVAAGILVFGALLCVTHLRRLDAPALVVAAVAMVVVTVGADRLSARRLTGWPGGGVDALVIVLLLLAIPDVVVFRASAALPNVYFEPGLVQFQHDYILGPVNQLLGGGALLVNVPVSQYGVGMLYFLGAWFHLAPIGYGTFGFLDGLLTALFYIAGYGTLRIAGLGRLLAGGTMLVAVVTLVYNLHYAIGVLPEQGPLRFGLPMLVILAAVAAARWPLREGVTRAVQLCVLAVASVWALEAFAYTALTFIALSAVTAWLRPAGERAQWLGRQLLLGLAACLAGHAILAAATLAGTGHLPDWGQYLAYGRALLLGGRAGAITYGFANWSPGLAFAAGVLSCAAALVLLVILAPATARRERLSLVALVGSAAYCIAMLSYTDNRSSTYLVPYVALPLLMAAAIWLRLLLRGSGQLARRGAIAFTGSVLALLLATAWPQVDAHFSRSALAHAYPGGGLSAALHRLWHPPPIDPRAPEGERIISRFMPSPRQLILLPTVPDLGTEILMRTHRANSMFIGDPKADGLVPSVWTAKLTHAVAQLSAGQRVLTDRIALAMLGSLRGTPTARILAHPLDGGAGEVEWLLQAIDRRFRFAPLYRDPDGLIVARLVSRRS